MENIRFPPVDDGIVAARIEDLRRYYRGNPSRLSDARIIDAIYGGEPMDRVIQSIEISAVDVVNRTVDISLLTDNPYLSSISIKGLNFKQWLVESSLKIDPENPPLWEQLDIQTRVEICQNELARWSVVIKSAEPKEGWSGRRVPPDLHIEGDSWCDEIELINNCTTIEGFEIKIRAGNTQYHGSFRMPEDPYLELCQRQAGAWARQGFIRVPGSGLRDPGDTNFTFGNELYFGKTHSDSRVAFDLGRYRKLSSESPFSATIEQNEGSIDYSRWGEDSEYRQKPFSRSLVMSPDACPEDPGEFLKPPKRYSDVQATKPAFKLPNFSVSGVYEVYSPQEKSHYAQLADLNYATIRKTQRGLHEISLERDRPRDALDLHRVVIGNIDFSRIPDSPDFLTIDRFCFSPRPTSDLYDPQWAPAVESNGTAELSIYAFLLGEEVGDNGDHALFIQPEGWGVERAILSFDEDRNKLTVDLISFERIVPVWQGEFEVGPY